MLRRPSVLLALTDLPGRGAISAPASVDAAWFERWFATTQGLEPLMGSHPMVDAVIDEIDGRLLRIGNHWLIDFASSNYLGFDLDPEIIDAVPAYLHQWGTQPGWSRYRGSPRLYEEIEEQVAELLGTEDALVLPTVSHVHNSVLPVLAGEGTIFVDDGSRTTLQNACMLAADRGATVHTFAHDDLDQLEELLRRTHASPSLICIDGINNMTGNAPDVRGFALLAREHDALLYVDDSHGFGVVGERHPDELCAYGSRGNGVIRHVGESYVNVVLVGGFSKAYSSTLAYVGCPSHLKHLLKTAAHAYLSSGQSPVASLATVLEGLKVNAERGDELRLDMYRMTQRVLTCLRELGIATPNTSGYPIIEIPLVNPEEIEAVGGYLYHHGIYAMMAAYPLAPKGHASFRLQISAANTWEQIENLISTLADLVDRFKLQDR